MAGVLLETLTNRQLILFSAIILALQVIFFLLGGLIAPAPNNVQSLLGNKCINKASDKEQKKWIYSRKEGACSPLDSLKGDRVFEDNISANDIVFVYQLPLPKDGQNLQMSRWFQSLVAVLNVEMEFDTRVEAVRNFTTMTLDVKLGYQNRLDPPGNWTEIASSWEQRSLHCVPEKEESGYPYHCEVLPLFELGSCHHDYYLINVRLPVDEKKKINTNLASITDIWIHVIHPNGGFTQVWLAIKTSVFPVIVAATVWYWRRVSCLPRQPRLLEKMLLSLSLAMSILNCPLEWLTLWFDMPWLLLLSDIRQGLFYSVLLCFWIIFCGEHMMDQIERNRILLYWKHLSAVASGCISLFVFEMCERGVQLTNPFFSIWSHGGTSKLALAFIIMACAAGCVYFLFLAHMVIAVFRNISNKKSALPQMASLRRKYYTGLIYRFQFLMLVTLVCAALTVIFFIIGQASEGSWKWGDDHQSLEFTSAFLTGVYGMWNLYVLSLLILYSPSHKSPSGALDTGDSSAEEIEFSNIPSEASVLTAFATKAATD